MSKLGIVMLEKNKDGQYSMLDPKHVIPLDKFKELLFQDFKEWLNSQNGDSEVKRTDKTQHTTKPVQNTEKLKNFI